MRVDLDDRGCLLNQRGRQVDLLARTAEHQDVHDEDDAEENGQLRDRERGESEPTEHEALTNKGAVDHTFCAGTHRPHPGHADEHGDDRDGEKLGHLSYDGVGSKRIRAVDVARLRPTLCIVQHAIDVVLEPSGDGNAEGDEQHDHVRNAEGAVRRLALQE